MLQAELLHTISEQQGIGTSATGLQARCDEKGFLAVTAFGLPGKTHEDSPARALSAAWATVQRLKVLA